jgi:hypothetical protein
MLAGMIRSAQCVIQGGRLTGFMHMPHDPFVWVRFVRDEDVRFSADLEPAVVDVLSEPLETVFSDDSAAQLMAVSEELLGLFDKYGITFNTAVSDLVVYDSVSKWNSSRVKRRKCRFLLVEYVHEVWRSYMKLVDVWVQMNASAGSTVVVDSAELSLMRTLLMEFKSMTPEQFLDENGWDATHRQFLHHLFTPEKIRHRLGSPTITAQLEARDVWLAELGYRKLW